MSSSICQGIQSCFEHLPVPPRVLGLALFPTEFVVSPVKCQDSQVYVHPLIRRSASVMSEKSLEMCTESLGSETGSGDFLWEDDVAEKFRMYSPGRESKVRKGNRSGSCDFPPPLKSMSGSSGVRMLPRRGDGRLVLQAVDLSSCQESFLVERGGGRLRLSIFREEDTTEDDGHEETAREAEDEEEEEVGCRQRPSRCKEGKGLLNWKPRWVAT